MAETVNALSFGDLDGEKEEGGDGLMSVWLERHLMRLLSVQVVYFLFKGERNDPQRKAFR